jgi:hypothetical protein
MRIPLTVLWCGVFSLCVGCDSKPPEKTVFDAQVKTIDRAREVEQTVQDHAQQLRDQVQKQESGEN